MKADFFSLFIYWGALLLSVYLCVRYQKTPHKSVVSKVLGILLICLPLSVVSGLRYNVGTDYEFYNEFFLVNGHYKLDDLVNSSHFELGFLLLVKLCNILFDKSTFFFFFTIELFSLFLAVCGFLKFSNRINLALSFFLYYIFFYHFSLNGIRSAIAISFLIFSYYYLINEKWLKYYLVIFGGFFFHNTIIICAIYPMILFFSGKYTSSGTYIKGSRKTTGYVVLIITMMYLLSTFLAYTIQLLFATKYEGYLESEKSEFGIGTIAMFVMYTIPLLVSNWNVIRNNKDYARLRDLAIFYIPVSLIGYYAAWGDRINMFSEVAFLFLFSLTANDKAIKTWSKYYTVGWCFLVYVYFILILNFHNTFPYAFISQ